MTEVAATISKRRWAASSRSIGRDRAGRPRGHGSSNGRKDPDAYGWILSHYCASLRGAFFHRYDGTKDDGGSAMTDRAQDGLEIILRACTEISAPKYAIAMDDATPREERDTAAEAYQAAE